MKRYYDIDRLNELQELCEKMNEIFYHMDKNEYERTKTYIYSRNKIMLPNELPAPLIEN
jgi:hypothetical protein